MIRKISYERHGYKQYIMIGRDSYKYSEIEYRHYKMNSERRRRLIEHLLRVYRESLTIYIESDEYMRLAVYVTHKQN